MSKKYVVERGFDGYWVAVWGCIFGTALLLFACLLVKYYFYAMILAIFFIIKFYYYRVIDFLFKKTIYMDDRDFYIQIAFIKLKLNRKTLNHKSAFLVIEEVGVPISRVAKFYGLVLVRNNEKIIDRLFKNKVKLYADGRSVNLEEIAKKISAEFDIAYIGRYT